MNRNFKSPIQRVLSLWPFVKMEKKVQLYIYGFLTIVSAFADLVSVGVIAPFIIVFIQPDQLLDYNIAVKVAEYFNLQTVSDLQLFLCLGFSCAVVFSGVTKLLLAWFQSRLSYGVAADLANQVFSSAMHKSYEYHLSINSSEIVSTIANKANIVADNLVHPMLSFLLAFVTVLVLSVFLFTLNPLVTIIVFSFIGSGYLLISAGVKKSVARASEEINTNFDTVMRIIREGLEGIRYVMLTGTHGVFIDAHADSERELRTAQADVSFASLFPRSVIESFALLVFAWVIYFFVGSHNEASANTLSLLAFFGVMAMAVQRLLPVAQQAYAGWTKLSGAGAIIDETLMYLDGPLGDELSDQNLDNRLKFDESIVLNGVSFQYQGSGQSVVLDNINLEINRYSKIGITGPSGAGKSTLLDLLMGFLKPVSGEILIDGVLLGDSSNVKDWHANVSLVPQNIYLSDSSILSNIAFGVPRDNIDFQKVMDVIKITQLEKFVVGLDDGYDYIVGEGGKNLSHGQRQRIGIARALYRETDLLVIDEGTSALDRQTQADVLEQLNSLENRPAIIMVAHRIEILADYDAIYEVKDRSLFNSAAKLRR